MLERLLLLALDCDLYLWPFVQKQKRRERLKMIWVRGLERTDITPKQRWLNSACFSKLWKALHNKLSSQRQELAQISGMEKSEITDNCLFVDVFADGAENYMAGGQGREKKNLFYSSCSCYIGKVFKVDTRPASGFYGKMKSHLSYWQRWLALGSRKQSFLQRSRLHLSQVSSSSFVTGTSMLHSPPAFRLVAGCHLRQPHSPFPTHSTLWNVMSPPSSNLLPSPCFHNLLLLLHRQETHGSHSPNNTPEVTSRSNNTSYDPLNRRTEHYSLLISIYKWNWRRRQFKWRFPSTHSFQGSTRWFLKVELIRADNLLRIQSTFLKWYKINGAETFTLIWNWTHSLYESWHLHMRKLHMGDQSFSLTGSASTHIDLGILCLPADTSTLYILSRLLKGHPENMLRRLQACISSRCVNWEPGFGKQSPHSCFRTVSIKVSLKVRTMLGVTKGLKVQTQQSPAVLLLQGKGIAANYNCCLQRFVFTKLWLTTFNCCQAPNANDDI